MKKNKYDDTMTIAMPNSIFDDMIEWEEEGLLNSSLHKEFIYSYYWYTAYLWRYAKYGTDKVTQQTIKSALGYNPRDARVNYIMKDGGLLDEKGFTVLTEDYPIGWTQCLERGIGFSMYEDQDPTDQKYYGTSKWKGTTFVKEPLLHTGKGKESEGLIWHAHDTHLMSKRTFDFFMSFSELGRPAFLVYGFLTYINDKNEYYNEDSDYFPCSNETISKYVGRSERGVQKITDALMKYGFIHKQQMIKMKGNANSYKMWSPVD